MKLSDKLAKVKAEVHRMDPTLKETDDYFKTGVLLLCSAIVGPVRAAKMSGYPPDFTEPRAERLRANGIWTGNKVVANWFEKDGGISLWMDVCVAEGVMERAQ